jgi:hypothetical protein
MIDAIEFGREFFDGLMAVDRAIVARAAEEPCRDCGGPLHRGDYPRRPRANWPWMRSPSYSSRDAKTLPALRVVRARVPVGGSRPAPQGRTRPRDRRRYDSSSKPLRSWRSGPWGDAT